MLPRRLVTVLFPALLGVGAAWTTGRATPQSGDQLPPELAALLNAQPTWSASAAAHAAVGHKDNLLLSSESEQESSLVRVGAEAFLWRLPRGGTDFSAFINAEQARYFSEASIDDESEAFAHFEWRHRLGDRWKFAIGFQGYYLDQVFDVSDTEIQRLIAELKMYGMNFGPTIRWSVGRGWWFEGRGTGKRERYDDGANDSRLAEGSLRLGWTGKRVEVDLAAIRNRRRFDRREQYSLGGRPVDGTLLRVVERELEGQVQIVWDSAERWKTTSRVSALQYRDNGSGFFNYRERKVTQELSWTGQRWSGTFEGEARRLEFDVQTVGVGILPPARVKDDFKLTVRAERKFSARWSGFAEYQWERSRSNDRLASYRVNEGLLGARWSWDK